MLTLNIYSNENSINFHYSLDYLNELKKEVTYKSAFVSLNAVSEKKENNIDLDFLSKDYVQTINPKIVIVWSMKKDLNNIHCKNFIKLIEPDVSMILEDNLRNDNVLMSSYTLTPNDIEDSLDKTIILNLNKNIDLLNDTLNNPTTLNFWPNFAEKNVKLTIENIESKILFKVQLLEAYYFNLKELWQFKSDYFILENTIKMNSNEKNLLKF